MLYDRIMRNTEQQRRAWECWVINIGPTNLMTFNFNGPTTVPTAHKAMERLFKRVEWWRHGRSWCKKKPALRPTVVAFMEHPTTNPHWHAAFNAAGDWTEALDRAISYWKTIIPSGQLDVRPVHDIAGLASYITKSQTNPGHLDGVFLYGPKRKA